MLSEVVDTWCKNSSNHICMRPQPSKQVPSVLKVGGWMRWVGGGGGWVEEVGGWRRWLGG